VSLAAGVAFGGGGVAFAGRSMTPWLEPGDRLTVAPLAGPLACGDVVVVRDGGEWLAHRVIAVAPLVTKGDRAAVCERPPTDAVIAVVVGFERGGAAVHWGAGGPPLKRLTARLSASTLLSERPRPLERLARWLALAAIAVLHAAVSLGRAFRQIGRRSSSSCPAA
jgi:hypothetical protein